MPHDQCRNAPDTDAADSANAQRTLQQKVSKLQHLVIYVADLERSKYFYTRLFDLQFSALNHPDSSAAMRIAGQQMHFYSFGFYHHDLCLVKHHRLRMDNGSLLHYSMDVQGSGQLESIIERLNEMDIPFRDGRLIASAKLDEGDRAVCFQDPSGHWIELLCRTN